MCRSGVNKILMPMWGKSFSNCEPVSYCPRVCPFHCGGLLVYIDGSLAICVGISVGSVHWCGQCVCGEVFNCVCGSVRSVYVCQWLNVLSVRRCCSSVCVCPRSLSIGTRRSMCGCVGGVGVCVHGRCVCVGKPRLSLWSWGPTVCTMTEGGTLDTCQSRCRAPPPPIESD